MKSLVVRWRARYDLVLAVGIPIISLVTVQFSELLVLRRLISLLAMLFSPGYLLLAALYPSEEELEATEWLAGSAAASIAMTILIGLTLNQTGLGIESQVFTKTLLLVSSLLAVIAYYRRVKLPERAVTGTPISLERPSVSRNRARAFLLVAAGSLLVLLVLFYYVALFPPQQKVVPTTQFYLEPVSRNLEELALHAEANQPVTVILGVVNLENRHMEYEMYQHIDGEPDFQIAIIDLEPGQEWETLHTFSLSRLVSPRQISFFLFRKEDPSAAYRTVYLWLRP